MKKLNRRSFARVLAAPSIALAGLVVIPTFVASSAAFAEEPTALTSTVTDKAGVISDEGSLKDAISSAQNKTGKAFRIVFVKNFGTTSGDSWAKQAFRKSNLSRSDAIVVVATESHQFSYFAGGEGYSTKDLKKAIDNSDVLDKWRSEDWAGGAKALVSNLEESASGGLGTAGTALLIGVPVVGAGAAAGVYTWRKRKKNKETQARNAEDLATLAKRAAKQLLDTDDGVRAAAAELEFARAEFGIEATRQFAEALASAQDSLQKAFVIRQQLDDEIPETPAQQWDMNQQILALTTAARESITAQEQGFQNLRNLSSRVDQHLAELETRANEIDGQHDILVAQIENLALTHSQAALATLRTYPDQITTLVTSARSSIASGLHNYSEGKTNEAVAFARMAEETLGHAAKRVEDIKGARESLDKSVEKVRAALASISSDVADAKRLGEGDSTIAARQADAERAIAAYSRDDIDPIKALSDLATAEDALDAALVNVRNEDEIRQRRAETSRRNRDLATQTIERAERIEGYGRYADQKARTLLASAREQLAKGDSAQSADAKDDFYRAAVSAANRAEDRIRERRDRDSYSYDYGSRDGSGIGHTVGGMLAGMVLGSLFNSGDDDHYEGGFSMGSFFDGDSDDGGFDFGDFDFDFGSGGGGSF